MRFGARGRYYEARSAQWHPTPFDPLTLWMSPVDTLNLALRWGAICPSCTQESGPQSICQTQAAYMVNRRVGSHKRVVPDPLVLRTQYSPEALHSTPCVADLQGSEGSVQGKRALALPLFTVKPPLRHAHLAAP